MPDSMTATGRPQGGIVYFEDVAHAPARRFGPLEVSTVLLDHLLDLMGEKHPVHQNEAFAQALSRRQRVVPGGFIHSITSGWVVQHGAPAAVVGLRSVHWDFVRPLYPDTPFYFTTVTEHAEVINDQLGLLRSTRRVCDEANRTYAIGRMNVVMLRHPTGAATGLHVDEGGTTPWTHNR